MTARELVIPSASASEALNAEPSPGAPSAEGAGRAIAIQLLSWGVTIPTGLVITAFLAHYLGAAQYGEYSFVVPLLSIFGLLGGIGMDPIVIRRLSRAPRDQWASTLSYAAGTRLLSTSVSALAVVAVAFLPSFNTDERNLLLIGSASLLFGFQIGSLRSIYDNAFRAEQRVLVPAVLLMADRLVTAGLVGLAVLHHFSLLLVYFLIVYSDLPFFVAMVVISRRRYGVRVRLSPARLREHVRTGLPLVSYDALVQVAWRADLFLLMALAGPISVGVYALALRVTDPLFAIVMAYVSGLFPLLCSTFRQGHSQFERSYHEATRLLALGTLPLAVFISVEAGPIVSLLGGRHFAPAIPALIILMWATAAGFFGQLAVRTCMSADLERTIPFVMAAAAGVNVVACLALIPRWNSTGAAVGALLSVVVELVLFVIILASRVAILPPFGALARVAVANLPGLAFLIWLRQVPILLTGTAYVPLVLGGYIVTRSLSRTDLASAWQLLVARRGRQRPAASIVGTDAGAEPAPNRSAPRPPGGSNRQDRSWWQTGVARVRAILVLALPAARSVVAHWGTTDLRVREAIAAAAAHPDQTWLRWALRAYWLGGRMLTEGRRRGRAVILRLAHHLDSRVSGFVAARHRGGTGAATIPAPVVAQEANESRACLRVTVTRGTEAITALAEEWGVLLERASRPTVFQSPEWLATWSRHLRNGEPWLIQVRTEDDTLVGIVPLQLQRPGVGPFRLRILRWLGYGRGALTDSLGPVFATGYEVAGIQAAWTHLMQEVPDWAMLDLDRTTDEFVEATRLWTPSAACRVQVYKSARWLYIRLPRDWPTLQRSLSRNLRSNLPRYRNRLNREGHAFHISILTEPEAVMSALPHFLELHARRSQASELKYHSNYFKTAASRSFISEAARILTPQGRMALAQMAVDGNVVAAQLLLFQGRMMTTYFSGFDPAWSRYSVMLLTQKACIEYAIEHGLQWVDLTAGAGGEDQTKRQWGNEEALTKHVMMTRLTLSGIVADWALRQWYILRRLQMWRRQSHRRSLAYILKLPIDMPGTAAPDATGGAVAPEEVGTL